MRQKTWEECKAYDAALPISPDIFRARSLLETAQERILFIDEKSREVKEIHITFVFEGYYTSVLEVLHALILVNGFRVENHVCLGYFLRDVLRREDLFMLFDDCRIKRNSLMYYGKRLDAKTARRQIENAKELIKEIERIIQRTLG